MIIDCYERGTTVGNEPAIRELYALGHGEPDLDTFGHVIFDCAPTMCFIHAQLYKNDIKSLRAIKQDILDLIDEVLIGHYEYPILSSYTPNKKFLYYIVKGTGWKVQEFEIPGRPDLTLCMVNLQETEQCPKS